MLIMKLFSKRRFLLSNVSLFFLFVLIASCDFIGTTGSKSLLSFVKAKDSGKEWLLKVGSVQVSEEEFLAEYQAPLQFANLPDDIKKNYLGDIAKKQAFLDGLEAQYLVFLEAEKGKMFDNPDFKRFLKMQVREAVYQYYLQSELGKDLIISDDDVADFYNNNKSMFPGPLDAQSEMQLRGYLRQKKISEKLSAKLGQFKEKSPISVNDKVDVFGRK
jgi:hypothetical protein